ncbi:MAG: septation protein A [Alphaproteobacteria bacterium]|nr:septation protein A [Alphaproteobacteria bacterium]
MNPQLRKLALDMGPLFIFFVAFEFAGIFFATGIFMIAALTSVALGWHFEKKLSPIPLLTAILVLIAGGLTLYLRNDVFIKMKPTGLYIIFGLTLLGGLRFNRLFIKYVFGEAFDLTEKGWRGLTLRWGIFFLALAAINEAVWRNTSTATWVSFKVWGITGLIFLFALAQTPFLLKHDAGPEQ